MKKVILITGVSSGIGKATLEKLVSDGHIVYGSVRKDEEKNGVKKMGGKPVKLDVTDYGSLEAAVKKVIKEQGRIDVLFNNAGYGLYGPVEDVSIEDAKRQFDVNLFGLARLTQLVLPHMRKQKSGTIINTSSMGGKIYTPFGAWYHATKHALEGWSDCLRLELKPFNINVVVIEPGMIETNFGNVVFEPLLARSKGSAYEPTIKAMMKSNTNDDGSPKYNGSPPSVIANVVSRAVAADKPKTRYAAGRLAKPLMRLRKYGGDRLYDWAIMRQFS